MAPIMENALKSPVSDPRWAQVVMRDGSADGLFFYAVKTTGIYCRPSCPSRLARPENVSFYGSAAEAEADGYRPCRRCHPDGQSLADRHAAAITQACRLIEESGEMPSIATLSAESGMSPSRFHHLFKAATGLSPRNYAAACRASRIRSSLIAGKASVTQSIYEAGFNSSSRFYEQSSDLLGMTPTRLRQGGKGISIRFAVGQCSLGAILVAMSDKGICAITLGDDPEILVRNLQDRFPNANLIGGDEGFESLVANVVAFVEQPQIGLDLPLDLQGTVFQRRVWQELRQIPAGETASYTEIAQRVGQPKAARAVAQACARNEIAVAIPCHRVVRNDGALSGYRWGIERKRALLAKEAGCSEASAAL